MFSELPLRQLVGQLSDRRAAKILGGIEVLP
jgi:hypothetical protein